jgi:outer membrane lipoprotein-sorting protein
MLSLRIFRRLFFVTLMALCGGAFADVFDHPVTAASKVEMSRLLAPMKKFRGVEGEFKQTKSIKKLNRDFVSTGTFNITKKSGVVWKTQKPFPSELTVTDTSVTERSANGSVRTIATKDNPVFAEFSKVIKAILFGDISELEKKFKVFYEAPGEFEMRIGLVPREPTMRKVIANIVMDFSMALHTSSTPFVPSLNRVLIMDGDGNPVTYEFLKQTKDIERPLNRL